MQADIREKAIYRECAELYQSLFLMGKSQISDAREIVSAPDGNTAIFSGAIVEQFDSRPPSKICSVNLLTGDTKVITSGPNTDRSPKYSPDGKRVAFLSDRDRAGNYQLYFVDLASGAETPAPAVDGWVEYFHWSPDGDKILLGVAGHGSDTSGLNGGVASKEFDDENPGWMPTVETGQEKFKWRSAWILEVGTGNLYKVRAPQINVWESTWCGPNNIAVIGSLGPTEADWYKAEVYIVDLANGETSKIYSPQKQIGGICSSRSSKYVALVESFCSDRGIIAGDLMLINVGNGAVTKIDTNGVDISHVEWRPESMLLFAGCRSSQRVIGTYNVCLDELTETWSSETISLGIPSPVVAGNGGSSGDCIVIGEGIFKAPEIAVVKNGEYSVVVSFDQGYIETVDKYVGTAESIHWQAPDGVKIEGWLLLPKTGGKHPLILDIHGGPVACWQPQWLARRLYILMLLKRGYAILWPNPRGSSGRGQDFSGRVFGDIGGAETKDHLSGLDYLVKEGIADPDRIGVTGASHGGYMTSWLISQDTRFSAAVALMPVSNWVSQHLTSNIPNFDALVLDGKYHQGESLYLARSPIMHAHKVKTPTLNICGGLDRYTPPGQAREYYNALFENGVESALVTYPQEGHGVRAIPAIIDLGARIVDWFEKFMGGPAGGVLR